MFLALIMAGAGADPASAGAIMSFRCPDKGQAFFDWKVDGNLQFKIVDCKKGERVTFEKPVDSLTESRGFLPPGSVIRQTEVELAFIEGTPGNRELADFESSLKALLGHDPFEAPYLLSSTKLFVGIDLNTWIPAMLSLTGPVSDGDSFEFVDGVSSLLPGFLVGTSEMTFTAATGWTTANPFTGSTLASGAMDGQVPEPSTLSLIVPLLIFAALGAVRRRRSPGIPGESIAWHRPSAAGRLARASATMAGRPCPTSPSATMHA